MSALRLYRFVKARVTVDVAKTHGEAINQLKSISESILMFAVVPFLNRASLVRKE
jgi:hypothetical protein